MTYIIARVMRLRGFGGLLRRFVVYPSIIFNSNLFSHGVHAKICTPVYRMTTAIVPSAQPAPYSRKFVLLRARPKLIYSSEHPALKIRVSVPTCSAIIPPWAYGLNSLRRRGQCGPELVLIPYRGGADFFAI